jgi:hypothetical protein
MPKLNRIIGSPFAPRIMASFHYILVLRYAYFVLSSSWNLFPFLSRIFPKIHHRMKKFIRSWQWKLFKLLFNNFLLLFFVYGFFFVSSERGLTNFTNVPDINREANDIKLFTVIAFCDLFFAALKVSQKSIIIKFNKNQFKWKGARLWPKRGERNRKAAAKTEESS